MANRIQLRRGTAAEWAAANPVLAQGEPGVESDTGKQKFGDGVTAWNSRPYASVGPAGPAGVVDDAAMAAKVTDTTSATRGALNATYVSMTQAQIGTDTDGVPYFASGLAFASSVPVKTDTDGVPYIAA